MKSIISDKKECWVCGMTIGLHKHHCLYGTANRRLSEKYGLWVYLCHYHHNGSNMGVHFNKEFDLRLKRKCQHQWERIFGDREQFISIFGRSYL